jgi:hypothetical protein
MGPFICKPNYVVQYKPAQACSAAKLDTNYLYIKSKFVITSFRTISKHIFNIIGSFNGLCDRHAYNNFYICDYCGTQACQMYRFLVQSPMQ